MNTALVKAPAQELLDSLDGTAYVVDAGGAIVAYGRPNWANFASKNGGPAIADPANILGRKLLDFVSGEAVKASIQRFMEDLRMQRTGAVVVPYRCDAPAFVREMRLAITPLERAGESPGFLFHSVMLSETMRPPLDIYDHKALASMLDEERRLPILAMCSYCLKVRFPPGGTDQSKGWVSGEEYYRLGGISAVRISHGICPECMEMLSREPV